MQRREKTVDQLRRELPIDTLWTPLRYVFVPTKRRRSRRCVECVCACGTRKTIREDGLVSGFTKSCRHTTALQLTEDRLAEMTAWLDGVLLGDGSISKQGTISVSQTMRRRGWLLSLSKRGESFGLSSTITNVVATRNFNKQTGRYIEGDDQARLNFMVTQETKAERNRWYPQDKKMVPPNLKLTDECLAMWFFGDGCGTKNGLIDFHTQGFGPHDIDRLCDMLNDGSPYRSARRYPSHCSRGWLIRVTRLDDARAIAERVMPYLIPCMRYKVQYIRQCSRNFITDAQQEEISVLVRSGWSYSDVARALGIPKCRARDHALKNGALSARTRHRMTEDKYVAAAKLLTDDMRTVKDVASELGVSPRSLSGRLVKDGIGRGPRKGHLQHLSKLDPKQAIAARQAYAEGYVTLNKLAATYDISVATAFKIVHGTSWHFDPLRGGQEWRGPSLAPNAFSGRRTA